MISKNVEFGNKVMDVRLDDVSGDKTRAEDGRAAIFATNALGNDTEGDATIDDSLRFDDRERVEIKQ